MPKNPQAVVIEKLKVLLEKFMNEHACHFANRHIHVDALDTPCLLCKEARELLKD